MALRKSKSAGNQGLSPQYVANAAKQIPFPVEYESKFISVHESEIQEAKENLMVNHLLNHGFAFQLTVTPMKQAMNEFKPEFKPRIVHKPNPKSEFKVGDQFTINSTGTLVEIKEIEERDKKGKKLTEPIFHFKYPHAAKDGFTNYEKNIKNNMSYGNWERKLK